MKFPVIKAPVWVNILITIILIPVSGFTLLFGIAHLIEGITSFGAGRNPNIPYSEHLLGITMVALLCLIGVVSLVITIAAIKGIIIKSRGGAKNKS